MQPLAGNMAPLGYSRGAAAAPWWMSGGISAANCVAAYAPKGAASLAASYSNLANPGTYDCTLGIAPNFSSAGWGFTGTQYLNTNVVPSGTNWSVFLLCTIGEASGNALGSFLSDSKRFHLFFGSATSIFYGYGSYTLVSGLSVTGKISLGMSNRKPYFNGIRVGSDIGAANTNGLTQYIGARNDNGAVSSFANITVHAASFYNRELSITENAAVHAAASAL